MVAKRVIRKATKGERLLDEWREIGNALDTLLAKVVSFEYTGKTMLPDLDEDGRALTEVGQELNEAMVVANIMHDALGYFPS